MNAPASAEVRGSLPKSQRVSVENRQGPARLALLERSAIVEPRNETRLTMSSTIAHLMTHLFASPPQPAAGPLLLRRPLLARALLP